MHDDFADLIHRLITPVNEDQDSCLLDATAAFTEQPTSDAEIARSLLAAFLIRLAGPQHPLFDSASALLARYQTDEVWGTAASFLHSGADRIAEEFDGNEPEGPLAACAAACKQAVQIRNNPDVVEQLWQLFYPEAAGIRGNEDTQAEQLRNRRTVRLRQENPQPLTDPAAEILFTSNVLLTVPASSTPVDDLPFSDSLKHSLKSAQDEQQRYWFDHPIQIGVAPASNEILYGLRGLNEAVEFERQRGNLADGQKVGCVLSVSVTHPTLQQVGKEYLQQEFQRSGGFEHLDIFAFTEADTDRLLDEVLVPAANQLLDRRDAQELLQIFGVDGAYGRHYSFLKAITAVWGAFARPAVKATFKIDLDQVFPQRELLEETGKSAFEHFRTALWGAAGTDWQGRDVELGMIAGALVNESDISQSVFTPDVRFPARALTVDEHVFFSALPQALSTAAEMTTRYDSEALDGQSACLQRIHVTGGTNGILTASLRKHRPFTPSFIGRAEDQAYLLSAFGRSAPRLAYLHESGLIMRHDKEAFAQEAIQAAKVGKMIGDYERILLFSRYARLLPADFDDVKAELNPFTGSFVSRRPVTVVYLRFVLKTAALLATGEQTDALEFLRLGADRIQQTLDFTDGKPSEIQQVYRRERAGWDLFHDTVDALETAVQANNADAVVLRDRLLEIIAGCALSTA